MWNVKGFVVRLIHYSAPSFFLCCVLEITPRLHALILLHRRLEKAEKVWEKKHNPGECKMPVLLLVFLFITADKRNAPGVLRVSLSGCEAARISVLILGHVSLTFTVKAKKARLVIVPELLFLKPSKMRSRQRMKGFNGNKNLGSVWLLIS